MNALILCNGRPPLESLFEDCLQWSNLFIAADGGANHARSFNKLPDIVIGDLDSFEPKQGEPFEVIHDPDQYSNDLEKALKLAKKKDIENVKVLGATGLRLDQTLKNLSVLKQFNAQFKEIIFMDEYGTTKLIPDNFSQDIEEGTIVSLFPLSGRVSGVSSRGLKYALQNDDLENGKFDGSSNVVVSRPITICYKKGDLLLFIAK